MGEEEARARSFCRASPFLPPPPPLGKRGVAPAPAYGVLEEKHVPPERGLDVPPEMPLDVPPEKG